MPPKGPIGSLSGALARSRGPLPGLGVFCWSLKPVLRPQRLSPRGPAARRAKGRSCGAPADLRPAGALQPPREGGAPRPPPPLATSLEGSRTQPTLEEVAYLAKKDIQIREVQERSTWAKTTKNDTRD